MDGKEYIFRVKTTEDLKNLPEGTLMYVEKELTNHYSGLCVLMALSFHTKIPKNKCIKLDNLK